MWWLAIIAIIVIGAIVATTVVLISTSEETPDAPTVSISYNKTNLYSQDTINLSSDNNSKSVSEINVEGANSYSQNTNVTITATFSKPIAETPVPKINIGGADTLLSAEMTRVSETEYTYTHTVGAGDGIANISITDFEDLDGNKGITDPVSGKIFIVDNTPPTASITYNKLAYKPQDEAVITLQFNEPVTAIPVVKIYQDDTDLGLTVVKQTGDIGDTQFTYSYTIPPSLQDVNLTVKLENVQDSAGNTQIPDNSVSVGSDFKLDVTPPTVQNITLNPTGPYTNGDTFVITATFSEAVTGPQISFGNPISSQLLNMSAGQNNSEFTYTFNVNSIPEGINSDVTIDIDNYEDLAGNVGNGYTSANAFSIDTVVPTLEQLQYNIPGPYTNNQTVTITATFSKAVTGPKISFSGAGTNTGSFDMTVGGNNTEYTYDYTIPANGVTTGTVTVTISDFTDNAGNVGSSDNNNTFNIDTDIPSFEISLSGNGYYKNGDTATITADFSKPVKDDPIPQITLTGTSINLTANMTKVSTTQYTYQYIVGTGDDTVNITASNYQDLAGKTGNTSPTTPVQLIIDNTVPTITSFNTPSGPYKNNDIVTITANFSEPVTGATVQLALESGETSIQLAMTANNDNTQYTYVYEVDASGDGEATFTVSNYQDLAGNLGSDGTGNFVVNITSPVATITYNPVGPYKDGDAVTITADFNEAVKDTPVPQITLSGAGVNVTATNMTKASAIQYTYDYAVNSGQTGTVNVAIGNFEDLAGNIGAQTTSTFTTDNIVPSVTNVTYNPTGPYQNGNTVTITADFNEAVKDTPVPQIILTGAGVNVTATNMTKASATQYTYDYTVNSGQTGTVNVAIGNYEDLAGNSGVDGTSSFELDNTPTQITSFIISPEGERTNSDTVTATVTYNKDIDPNNSPSLITLREPDGTLKTKIPTTSDNRIYNAEFTLSDFADNGEVLVTISSSKDTLGNNVNGDNTTFVINNFKVFTLTSFVDDNDNDLTQNTDWMSVIIRSAQYLNSIIDTNNLPENYIVPGAELKAINNGSSGGAFFRSLSDKNKIYFEFYVDSTPFAYQSTINDIKNNINPLVGVFLHEITHYFTLSKFQNVYDNNHNDYRADPPNVYIGTWGVAGYKEVLTASNYDTTNLGNYIPLNNRQLPLDVGNNYGHFPEMEARKIGNVVYPTIPDLLMSPLGSYQQPEYITNIFKGIYRDLGFNTRTGDNNIWTAGLNYVEDIKSSWVAVGVKDNNGTPTGSMIYSITGSDDWQYTVGEIMNQRVNNIASRSNYTSSDKWVAVGYDDADNYKKILYSNDGITWNKSRGVTFLGDTEGVAVAVSDGLFNNSKWVVLGSATDSYLFSNDGETWSAGSGPVLNNPNKVIHDGTRWIAVTDNKILISDNGETWSEKTITVEGNNATGPFKDILYSKHYIINNNVAQNQPRWHITDGNKVLYSEDFNNWTYIVGRIGLDGVDDFGNENVTTLARIHTPVYNRQALNYVFCSLTKVYTELVQFDFNGYNNPDTWQFNKSGNFTEGNIKTICPGIAYGFSGVKILAIINNKLYNIPNDFNGFGSGKSIEADGLLTTYNNIAYNYTLQPLNEN
jgi:hypothetical protein